MSEIKKKVLIKGLKLHIIKSQANYINVDNYQLERESRDLNEFLKDMPNIEVEPSFERETIFFDTVRYETEEGLQEIHYGLTEEVRKYLGIPLKFIEQQSKEIDNSNKIIESLELERDILTKEINDYKKETKYLRKQNSKLKDEIRDNKNINWLERLKFLFLGEKYFK